MLAEERRFWQDVAAIARPVKDRKVHAYARKMFKWIGAAMLEVARDQMADDSEEEMSEEYIKKMIDEDKKSPSDKIRDEAMMNALSDAQWGDSPF